MRPAKRLQINVDEDEEEKKGTPSPKKTTRRQSVKQTPEPKVIVTQDEDLEIFMTDVPDDNFEKQNEEHALEVY